MPAKRISNPAADDYRTYVPNPWFEKSSYPSLSPGSGANRFMPALDKVRDRLPQPFWEGGESAIEAYWKVWEIAFRNIRPATAENGFFGDYADTAFNDCTFMWDSAFITMFWRYGIRAWDAMGTLENFYGKQHCDGFICRQLRMSDGFDAFQRHDPNSTGPNVLPWAEWEYFRNFGDRQRLQKVFPPLAAYTRWFRRNRTWPDGSHWATGWASGMDDQPRRSDAFMSTPPELGQDGFHANFDHGHMSWVDACFQAIFANRILVRMAEVLGIEEQAGEFANEARFLTEWCNAHLWDEQTGFYHDRLADGSLVNQVKSIGAYWALPAGAAPRQRRQRMIDQLSDEKIFNRAHRVPSMSADSFGYETEGGYWRGAVWAPTNYMVLRGLTMHGEDALAHEIGINHLRNVVEAYAETGTFFENYGPDTFGKGRYRPDFIGWTGVPPVAVLFEYVFGIRPEAKRRKLIWDVRLLDAHGVSNYPFGSDGNLELKCEKRQSPTDKPVCRIRSDIPLTVDLRWEGGRETIEIFDGCIQVN